MFIIKRARIAVFFASVLTTQLVEDNTSGFVTTINQIVEAQYPNTGS